MSVPYIHTRDGITVVLNNKPFHAAKDDAIYERVVDAINGQWDVQDILEIFEGAAKRLEEVTKLTPNMEHSGGVVKYKGEVLQNYAVDFLVRAIQSNEDYTPLVMFLENLMQNPSKRVVDDLYRFLEKGRMPITADGHFLAYKKVRADYKDIHSGKFENKVGAHFEMPRNQVDEDAQRTCSTGFHVCSYDYLPQFAGGRGERVMVCKINPADVVAIPADYNDTKMRVYKYKVTDEVTDYFQKQENVLTKQAVSGEKREFAVVYQEDWLDDPIEVGRYWTLEEARREAEDIYNDSTYDVVRVLHAETDDILVEYS